MKHNSSISHNEGLYQSCHCSHPDVRMCMPLQLNARAKSVDGLDLSFATNTLGTLLLTEGLLPALEKAKQSRVVFVSSGGMYTGDHRHTRLFRICSPQHVDSLLQVCWQSAAMQL